MSLWGAHVERIGARSVGLLGQQRRAGAWACPWGPGSTLNFTWLNLELALSVLVGPGWWDQPWSQRCSPEPAELAVKPKQPQMDSVTLSSTCSYPGVYFGRLQGPDSALLEQRGAGLYVDLVICRRTKQHPFRMFKVLYNTVCSMQNILQSILLSKNLFRQKNSHCEIKTLTRS